MKLKLMNPWKRYQTLTRLGTLVYNVILVGSTFCAAWLWLRSTDELGFLLAVLAVAATSVVIWAPAVELVVFLFPGLRDPARDT